MPNWTMNYTAHLGLRAPDAPLFIHSAASPNPSDQIKFIADLGFAGVQDNFLKLRSAQEQAQIGRLIEQHNLQMGSFNNNPMAWNRPLWSKTDKDSIAELEADLGASIETAKHVNGRYLTCVTALDPDISKTVQLNNMAQNLHRLADSAANEGLILLVEPVAPDWISGMLIDSLADAVDIIQQANHPHVKLLYDIAHVEMSDGHAFEHLKTHWDITGLIQAADVPARVELGFGTSLDWPAILRWIKSKNADALIELEHLPNAETAEGEKAFINNLRKIDAAI